MSSLAEQLAKVVNRATTIKKPVIISGVKIAEKSTINTVKISDMNE